MPDLDIQWVRDDATLARCCREWEAQAFVTLDTEFIRVETFYPIAGLVQVGDGTRAYLIDPLTISDWSPFAALLENRKVCKVLHACSEDLEVFQRLCGALPTPLFDTQLAAGYLNIGFSMGYSRLAAALLSLELPKEETRSDWLQRPLTPMQVQYAAADVTYLADIYRRLDERLSEEKRAWILEDGAEWVAAQARVADPEQAYREVKLAWKLPPRQLAILQAICAWREREARRRDVPRSRILRERSLWPLAQKPPANLTELARVEEMHPKTVRQDGETLLRLIREAAGQDPQQWPQPLPEPLPLEASSLLKKLRKVGQSLADAKDIAPELMLRKKLLEALLKSGYPEGPYQLPDSLRGWRRELMGDALLNLLNPPPAGEHP